MLEFWIEYWNHALKLCPQSPGYLAALTFIIKGRSSCSTNRDKMALILSAGVTSSEEF